MSRPTPSMERIGWTMLLVLAAIAVLAPALAPYDPTALTGAPFEAPGSLHWLGTNDIGQDLLSELLYATRASLMVGGAAALLSVGIGATLGLLAAARGGGIDAVVMRAVDLVLTTPFLPVLILCAAYLGPSPWMLVATIGALTWARPARLVHAQARAVLGRDFVLAARSLGTSLPALLARHVLPNTWPLIVAEGVIAVSQALALESALSFLGLGDPGTKSWGSMLFYAQARNASLTGAWLWWVVPPGVMITVAVLGAALAGLRLERSGAR